MSVILSERADVGRDRGTRSWRAAGQPSRLAASFDRGARTIGQVTLFAVFGLCGAVVGGLVVPVYWTLVSPARRTAGVRDVVHRMLGLYIRTLQAMRLIDLEFVGLDRTPPAGSMIVANHPSLLDALILLNRVKGGVVVAKRSLQVNPFTWGFIRGAHYIVNADPAGLIEDCRARIAAGEVLVLFPECTRTAADGQIRLRRGAAHIAVRSGCPVIPVTIELSEPVLGKQCRWWLAPKVRPRVRVTRHESIEASQFMNGRSAAFAARRLTEHLQTLYTKELSRRGPA